MTVQIREAASRTRREKHPLWSCRHGTWERFATTGSSDPFTVRGPRWSPSPQQLQRSGTEFLRLTRTGMCAYRLRLGGDVRRDPGPLGHNRNRVFTSPRGAGKSGESTVFAMSRSGASDEQSPLNEHRPLSPGAVRSVIVVALGGNALVHEDRASILDQLNAVHAVAPSVVDLVEAGHGVVLTHGNGPQVGYILRRSELAIAEVSPVPIDFAVADTQGAIGHMFLLALRNELLARGLARPVTAIVTQVIVDPDDPAFWSPTKPIGSHFTRARAEELGRSYGWTVAEDSGRGWRRMVASPSPIEVAESAGIDALLTSGHVVIAGGGGGIPVARGPGGELSRMEAVVDKDATSSLLARQLDAQLLVILTSTERVAVGFGRPDQRWLSTVTADEMRRHLAAGEFGAGSMAPKVEAALAFVTSGATDSSGRCAVITSADRLRQAVRPDGSDVTRIVTS